MLQDRWHFYELVSGRPEAWSPGAQRAVCSSCSLVVLQVKEQLEGVAEQALWNQAAPANEFKLPAFSAYPGPYITAVGEYLMMLPALLESVLVDGAEAPGDESHVDGEWLDKVLHWLLAAADAAGCAQSVANDSTTATSMLLSEVCLAMGDVMR